MFFDVSSFPHYKHPYRWYISLRFMFPPSCVMFCVGFSWYIIFPTDPPLCLDCIIAMNAYYFSCFVVFGVVPFAPCFWMLPCALCNCDVFVSIFYFSASYAFWRMCPVLVGLMFNWGSFLHTLGSFVQAVLPGGFLVSLSSWRRGACSLSPSVSCELAHFARRSRSLPQEYFI